MASEQRRRGPANRDPRVWQHHMRQGKQKHVHNSFPNCPIPFFPPLLKKQKQNKPKLNKNKKIKTFFYPVDKVSFFFLLSVKRKGERAGFIS